MTELVETVVLICDNIPDEQHEIIDSSTLIVPEERVPVRLDFDPLRPIGWATLRRDGNRVYAAISLEDVAGIISRRRGESCFYPCISGQVGEKIPISETVTELKGVLLDGVSLCSERNADSRIGQISVQSSIKT